MKLISLFLFLTMLAGCKNEKLVAERAAAKQLVAKVQVMAEKGMNHQDAVELAREVSTLLRTSQWLGDCSNSIRMLEMELDQAAYFSNRRYTYLKSEDLERLELTGLMDDNKVWRITETQDWLDDSGNYESIRVFAFTNKTNEKDRRWYNQRYVFRNVLDSVHLEATTSLQILSQKN